MRKLTKEEIIHITSNIDKDCIPTTYSLELREHVYRQIVQPIEKELQEVEIMDDPELLQELYIEIKESVRRALIQPGEAVGILCAQSIGERQTQLTLNSFHSAGLAIQTVVSGVPRFLELLNATREPKVSSNIFHIKTEVDHPLRIREILSHHLVSISFQDLVKGVSFFSDRVEEVWFGAFENVYTNEFRDYRYGLTISLDTEKLYQYHIPMTLIKDKLESAYADLVIVFSPVYVGQLDIFVDTQDIVYPFNAEEMPSFLTPDNYIQVFLEDVVKPKLMEIHICGIPNILKYHIRKMGKWVIETEGTNYPEILGLSCIDAATATSTNMWDIYDTFGIEAVREFLVNEFKNVVSADGTFINPAHILLLVDIMTHQGTINSISRYGMKKEQTGVLTRSSFEESLDQFCKAGYTAEKEPIKAVSAAIMCGKRSRIGTGICALKMNWQQIIDSV